MVNNDCQCGGSVGSEGCNVGAIVIRMSSASSPSLGIGIPDTSVLKGIILG